MAEGIGLSIDLSFIQKLNNADKQIEELMKKTNELSRVTITAFQQMANSGVTPYIEQLNRQKKALEEIAKIKGTGTVLTKMQSEAKIAVDEINNVVKALEKTKAYRGEQSGKNAISFANSVLGQRGEPKSIDNMRTAIRQLEEAQNRLNLNTKTGQKNYEKIGETIKKVKSELDKATGANKKLTQESEKTKSTVQGLGGAISAAFAVNAIRGFLNNLIKMRGEFELQHRSLQVLLQDVDEANELWDKTVALAVKSPYRVKDLVTYTKQLAAYRVESEKLYDTTRMLADVSSGLGIDMNRLILAFGQVKAANFLRGTELRQFSEAGVNMLEELSKRFTKLEGRAVSVGDVFERVSKRMVKFSDVEAVFQTITSEGGVFYQMQEKQSETLRGMIMNLKDSIDLMFNEIGKASDSPLKGAIQLVRELVENWRKVIPVVSAAGAAFLAGFSVKTIASIGKAFKALWTVIKANPIAATISIIAALVAGIISARKNINELTAAMNEVDRDITKQLEDSIALYRKLAEKVRDVTSTEKDRNKAMEQLKTKFDEILPDQLLELEYIQNIADNYDEATNAMMNYYNSKATEQKRDRIESQFGKDIDTQVVDLIGGTRKMIETWRKNGLINEREQIALLSGVGSIVRGVSEGIKNGEVDNDFDSVRRAILKKLSEYAGVDSTWEKYLSGGGSMLFEKNIHEMIREIANFRNAIEGIEGLPTETYAEKEAADIFLPEKSNIEAVKNTFKEVITLVSEYSNIAVGKWKELDENFNAIIGKLPEEAASYLPLLYDMFEKMKVAAASEEEGGASFDFAKSIQGFQQDFTNGLANVLWEQTGKYMFNPINENVHKELVQLVTNMNNTLRDEAERLDLTDFQKSVVNAMEIIAKVTKVNVNEFSKFIPKIGDSLSTTREAVEGEISLLKGDIERWNNSLQAMPPASIAAPDLNKQREGALGLTQEKVDNYKELVTAFEMLRTFLGGGNKEKKKTDNTIEERIKVVDQMNKKYLELKKTLSETDALQGAFEAYKDAFATAYGRENVRQMSAEDFAKNVLNFPDEDKIITWLDNLAKTVTDKEDKFKVQFAKGKFEMDIQVRDKKALDKQLEKDIQDMFDEYDLSLEIKKLNIPPDIAQSLFGVKSTDLKDIRKKIEDELTAARAEKGNEDRIKQLEKDLEKVNDMEDKAQIERLKTYLQYTRDAIGERAKIKIEEMTKLQEIDETFTKAMNKAKTEEDKKRIAEQRKLAEEGVRKESSAKTNKLDWEDFKTSETFVSIFRDLDTASDDLLKHAIKKIQQFREEWKDMPIADAKEMINKLNELEMALLDTGKPFADYRKANKDIEMAMLARNIKPNAQRGKSQEELRSKIGVENKNMEDIIAQASVIESVLQSINNATGENKQEQLALIGINEKYVTSLGLSEDVLTNTIEKNEEILEEERGKAQLAEEGIAQNKTILQQLTKQKDRLNQQEDAIGKAKQMANDLYDAFKGLAEALGADGDSPAAIFADMGMSMLNTVLNTIQLQLQLHAATIAAQGLGVAMNAAMGVIGWIVMGVQLLTSGIKAIAKINDNKIVAQLEAQAAIIEKQRDLYEQIEERVDKAYSVEELRQYNDEMKRSVELEIKALEASIALEKSRKNADEDQIADWQKEIDEAKKRLEESTQEMKEMVGGIFDLGDFTSGFIDAWWDAMEEGMDGLDALNDHFDETMKDMVKKQALYRGAQEIMKQVQEVINQDLADDYEIDDWQKIWDVAKKANVDLDAFLQGWYEMFGSLSDGASGGLSALQKGIHSLSESTGQVIESLLNSLRFYVADSNSELKSQTKYMRDMYNMLSSMTAIHSQGGRGIKVVM